ncbi:MAG: hypothetical protein HOV83_08140, partial [Catenulispora sp.]|nr:hypothetical protein [Catenulispora sp.]
SLLYGYFGQSAPSLLQTRLEAILAGAAVGVAASWFVLPVRTRDVLKRRVADALAALGDFLGAPKGDRAEVRRRRGRFLHAVTLLEQIARPLRAQRLLGLGRRADVVDAVHDCVDPVGTLAAVFADMRPAEAGQEGQEADWEPLRRTVAANVAAIRRSIGRKPGAAYRAVQPETRSPAASALCELDAALAILDAVYGPAPAPEGEPEPGKPGADEPSTEPSAEPSTKEPGAAEPSVDQPPVIHASIAPKDAPAD